VLALGTVAVVAGILLIAFLAALRTSRRSRAERPTPGRTATIAAAAARAGVTPVATTGVRIALEPGRGPTTIPVRSAIFGAVFGILGVVAVLMFASSLDQLVASPAQYGWTWHFAAVVDDPSVYTAAAHERGLAAAAELFTVNVQLDGRPVIAWGYMSLRGTIDPEIITGRAPSGPDEIALGAATLDELGKRIGDTVHGEGPDGSHNYRIVGRAVFPKLDSPQPLANGAAFTGTGLATLLSPADSNNGSYYLVARVAPGAELAAVEHRLAAASKIERPFGPTVPVEADRLRQVNWLPVTLAALLATLALLAVGHALITSVRRHRRELAVLKTLGFDRHQIRATVAWQATTLATIGLIVGIPAGVIIGSLVWRQVANSLGISTTPAIPGLALLLTVPGALAAVNLIAFFPARAAAGTRPAVALRTE
jgi:FtsX-like permease family